MLIATLSIALVLAMVHVFGGRIAERFGDRHHWWLSAGAGITVAFVFLYLLPELEHLRVLLERHPALGSIEEVLYLTGLLGVTLYYGLEHLACRVREQSAGESSDEPPFGHDYVFWLHMGWYAVYNVIIGVLLLYGEQETAAGLLSYAVAMVVHLATVDAAMRRHHLHVYRSTGRWLLAAAVLTGWLIGVAAPVGEVAVAVVLAFLVGGLLINAIKEELPASGRAKFIPFLLGVAAYAAILFIL